MEEARLAALEDADRGGAGALASTPRLVGELEALVREHPLRERLVGQLMLALYRSGRQADALEAYRVARRGLVEELGLEPGRELQRLERAILTQDPALEPAARVPSEPATRSLRSLAARGADGALIAAGAALLLVALVAVATAGWLGREHRPEWRRTRWRRSTSDATASPRRSRWAPDPGAVAFGSGSLWVANLDDQTVSRIDPATLRRCARSRSQLRPRASQQAATAYGWSSRTRA